jgi:preprotein translocase subunit YajC
VASLGSSSIVGFFLCRPQGGQGVRNSRSNADSDCKMITHGISLLSLSLQAQPGGIIAFLPLLLILVIFYFLLIMPAQRRQKKVAEMHRSLKVGDKVITNGGIYGTIVGLEGDAVQLRVADQVKLKVSRTAIAGMQTEPVKEAS